MRGSQAATDRGPVCWSSDVNWTALHILVCIIISSSIQLLRQFGQEPEPSQATGMALVRCILGKFLGVVCHCFPARLDVPTFTARFLHVRKDARDPSSEKWNYGQERLSGNFAYMAPLFTPLGIFCMPPLKTPTASAGFEPANLGY